MDRAAGPSRLPGVKGVLLVQTDTTVGFVSRSAEALARCKDRPVNKPFLKTYATLRDYQQTGRIPTRFKRELRRSSRTTYVVRGEAFRIVSAGSYHRLLAPYGWLYSTSANRAGARFELPFARAQADVIVEEAGGLYEDVPSNIYQLNTKTKRRIR